MCLIDNSGSMRGGRIQSTACWISTISNILAQANIPVAVAGFTTRAWKGGSSRELWIRDGKPEWPGRLNDLRYIVYKSFEQTQQEADTNFALMIREGLLKENIDGEAILWGYSQLIARQEERKLLLIISDGAPVDDSTLAENSGNFLIRHCTVAINWIRSQKDVELYGIGLDVDVSRYYGVGSPTLNSGSLGPDLLAVTTLALANNWREASIIQREPPKMSRSTPSPRRRSRKTPLKPTVVGGP
jgi:cobaltochelatase CobT